ncbi:leucine-rich repeat flightless-interacting protein 2 isoform X10, partial [Silurus asotus]
MLPELVTSKAIPIISLADAEEKHQNAVEIITQMEVEKSGLQDKIVTLQKTVQEMGNLLIESNKECDNLTNEHERELETHNLLKIKYKEMEESLAHKEELLK